MTEDDEAVLKHFRDREPHVQALLKVAGASAGTLLAASVVPTPKRPDLAAALLRDSANSLVDAAAAVMGGDPGPIREAIAKIVAEGFGR